MIVSVTLTNLRTNETRTVRRFTDLFKATARAERGNELARACRMTHLLYRAVIES